MTQETMVKLLGWLIAALVGAFGGYIVGRADKTGQHVAYKEGFDAGVAAEKSTGAAASLHDDIQKLNEARATAIGQLTEAQEQPKSATTQTSILDASAHTSTAPPACTDFPPESAERLHCTAEKANISSSQLSGIQADCAARSANHSFADRCVADSIATAAASPAPAYGNVVVQRYGGPPVSYSSPTSGVVYRRPARP